MAAPLALFLMGVGAFIAKLAENIGVIGRNPAVVLGRPMRALYAVVPDKWALPILAIYRAIFSQNDHTAVSATTPRERSVPFFSSNKDTNDRKR